MASTKFNVVLDLPLTAAQIAAIEKDINKLVKVHIAKIDNTGFALGIKRIPPGWKGIWLKRFKDLKSLRLNEQFRATR